MTQHLPYGTPETPRLAVRGEAHLEVDPETAHLDITVNARGTEHRTTLDDLTRRNTQVLDLLKTYDHAIEKLETGSFTITPQLTEKGRHERIHAYHGHVHTTATISDFTTLGELTARLTALDLTRVDGPWWSLRPDSPAHRAARRQAVHEAVQRAREYADALGARLDAILELADIGADAPTPPGPMAYGPPGVARSAAGYGGGADPEPVLDLEPQRQHVYAQVNARFTMTRPTL
ncbi:SIMPL domain-containing protein [Streptomyces sp. NPDC057654]|uniref:SIMPL domain-containing protein n=1 Tax=Streptomyces sp. NPDC057654 TaxID=3346196 RepID=UPI0036CE769F